MGECGCCRRAQLARLGPPRTLLDITIGEAEGFQKDETMWVCPYCDGDVAQLWEEQQDTQAEN